MERFLDLFKIKRGTELERCIGAIARTSQEEQILADLLLDNVSSVEVNRKILKKCPPIPDGHSAEILMKNGFTILSFKEYRQVRLGYLIRLW